MVSRHEHATLNASEYAKRLFENDITAGDVPFGSIWEDLPESEKELYFQEVGFYRLCHPRNWAD